MHAKNRYPLLIVAVLLALSLFASCNGPLEPGDVDDLPVTLLLDGVEIKVDGADVPATVEIDATGRKVAVTLTKPADLSKVTVIPKVDASLTARCDYGTLGEPLGVHTVRVNNAEGETLEYQLTLAFADSVPTFAAEIGDAGNVKFTDDTPIGRFVADALAWYGRQMVPGLDFAFLNAGGIRGNLASSPLTKAEVALAYPFDDTLVVVDLTGSEIKSIIARAALNAGVGGWGLVSAGFAYQVFQKDPDLLAAREATLDGVAIADAERYQVAFPSYLVPVDTAWNDGYTILQAKSRMAGSKATIADIIYAYAASFATGAVASNISRVDVAVDTLTADHSKIIPGRDIYSLPNELGKAGFYAYHTDERYELRLGEGLFDFVEANIVLGVRANVDISGGWKSADTVSPSGETYLLCGKNGSAWRRLQFWGPGTRNLNNLVIDAGGNSDVDVVWLSSDTPTVDVTKGTDVVFTGVRDSASYEGAWRLDGKFIDYYAPPDTASSERAVYRKNYNEDGTQSGYKLGTYLIKDGNLLEASYTHKWNTTAGEWAAWPESDKYTMNRWRFVVLDDRLYRGALTRISDEAGNVLEGTYANVIRQDDTWLKQVVVIDSEGDSTVTVYKATNDNYWHFGDYGDGDEDLTTGGIWDSTPVATYDVTFSSPSMTGLALNTLYDIEIISTNVPDQATGAYEFLFYDQQHLGIMTDLLTR